MTRLYFNRRGDKPWSTDHGPGTPETQWHQLQGMGGRFTAVFDPSAGDNLNTPTAWIEFDEVILDA